MAWRFAKRIGAIRENRLARIDLQKNPWFHSRRAIRANRLKPAICNFQPSGSAIRKNGVQLGNPETIRENQAIRANLQIDSRESGHLSAIEMGGVSRYFSKVSGSGVDVTLLMISKQPCWQVLSREQGKLSELQTHNRICTGDSPA